MSDENVKDVPGAENIEVEPLSDKDLESIAGGGAAGDSVNYSSCCSVNANSCCDTEVESAT